jgi:hypothetical protein
MKWCGQATRVAKAGRAFVGRMKLGGMRELVFNINIQCGYGGREMPPCAKSRIWSNRGQIALDDHIAERVATVFKMVTTSSLT